MMKKSVVVLCAFAVVLFTGCISTEPAGESVSDVVSPAETEIRDEADKEPEKIEPPPAPAVGTRGAASDGKSGEMEYFVEESGDTPDGSFTGATAASRVASRDGVIPSSSGLKAGFADDNRQYGYFLNFLDEYSEVPHYDLEVNERIIIQILDNSGKPVSNAEVAVELAGQVVARGVSLADGTFQFNPSSGSYAAMGYRASVSTTVGDAGMQFARDGLRKVTLDLGRPRVIPNPVPLDILFILDTTGSMGEEIQRLRATIELIHLNLTSMRTNPDVRFGMVLYKDTGDEYDTKIVPLTDDLEAFRSSLELVEASGGGDTPEDLQSALERTMHGIDWNPDGIRLGFIITDAPPHLDYDQEYTYADASAEARERGIKLFCVGTGGLPLAGEYVLRQIAQYTGGKYIFLTYGESGESEGGEPGSVSHHTGANYQTDKLEAIIIRFAKEELSHLTDEPLEDEDPYFQAIKIASEDREQTLSKLFRMAFDQLSDYSTYPLGKDAVAAVLPVEPSTETLGINAEYFSEQMMLAMREHGGFTLVDRTNIEEVMNELKFQLSGLTDSDTVAEVGNLLNAQVLIAGKLYMPDDYELFLRLLRVETGEVLSVTKAVIDNELGLTER